LHADSGSSASSSSVFFDIFIAEEVDGAGDMESGDTTMVDVWTLSEAF